MTTHPSRFATRPAAKNVRWSQLLSGVGLLLLIVHHLDVYPTPFDGALRMAEGVRTEGNVEAQRWGGEGGRLPPMSLQVVHIDAAVPGSGPATIRAQVEVTGALGAGTRALERGKPVVSGDFLLDVVESGIAPEFDIRDERTGQEWADYALSRLWAVGSPEEELALRGVRNRVRARFYPDFGAAHAAQGSDLTIREPVLEVRVLGEGTGTLAHGQLRVGQGLSFGETTLTLTGYRTWAVFSVRERVRPWALWAGLALLGAGLLLALYARFAHGATGTKEGA